MNEEWYSELRKLNARILAMEARLAAQVTSILETTTQGPDNTDIVRRITDYREELFHLRMMRDPMLDAVERNL